MSNDELDDIIKELIAKDEVDVRNETQDEDVKSESDFYSENENSMVKEPWKIVRAAYQALDDKILTHTNVWSDAINEVKTEKLLKKKSKWAEKLT